MAGQSEVPGGGADLTCAVGKMVVVPELPQVSKKILVQPVEFFRIKIISQQTSKIPSPSQFCVLFFFGFSCFAQAHKIAYDRVSIFVMFFFVSRFSIFDFPLLRFSPSTAPFPQIIPLP